MYMFVCLFVCQYKTRKSLLRLPLWARLEEKPYVYYIYTYIHIFVESLSPRAYSVISPDLVFARAFLLLGLAGGAAAKTSVHGQPRRQRMMASLGGVAVKLEGAAANDQPFVWESEIGQITVINTVCAAYASVALH